MANFSIARLRRINLAFSPPPGYKKRPKKALFPLSGFWFGGHKTHKALRKSNRPLRWPGLATTVHLPGPARAFPPAGTGSYSP